MEPCESEDAHGGMMLFALGAPHRVISGPEGMLNGLGGILMNWLTKDLYATYLQRDAANDTSGWNFWTGVLDGDETRANVRLAFARSSEFGEGAFRKWQDLKRHVK